MPIIPHPDRPDEYLHAGIVVCQNRDESTPHLEVLVDSRYSSNCAIAQQRVEVVRIEFDPDDPNHLALYQAASAVALDGVQICRDNLQAARDARLAQPDTGE